MQVVNLAKTKDCVRCDRTSILGNPFKMQQECDRTLVIKAFREYLFLITLHRVQPVTAATTIAERHSLPISKKWKRSTRSQFLDELSNIQPDSWLGCWCAPEPCHCDVIISYLVWRSQQLRSA